MRRVSQVHTDPWLCPKHEQKRQLLGQCGSRVVLPAPNTEWYYGARLHGLSHVEQELFEYIERYYNAKRLHASIGYVTPTAFEANALVKVA